LNFKILEEFFLFMFCVNPDHDDLLPRGCFLRRIRRDDPEAAISHRWMLTDDKCIEEKALFD